MPWRLRAHRRALATFGITVEDLGGSHPWKAIGKDKAGKNRKFPFVAHNGLSSEIDDAYINALCRQFDLDLDAYLAALQQA